MMPPTETLHGTLVVVGEIGVLITGRSGSGKSSLALAMILRAGAMGQHARLVGDDRVRIVEHGHRLVGRGHPILAGRIEARGIGLIPHESADAVIIRAVVTLDEGGPRLPEQPEQQVNILGIVLPRLALRPDQDLPGKADLVLDWLTHHFAAAKNS